MLVMKDQQIAALRRARVERFLRELRDYIAREYPDHFARPGADGTIAFIKRGIDPREVWRSRPTARSVR